MTTNAKANGSEPIRILADGTIKQVNPLSGTQVWTVPGRGNRPIKSAASSTGPINRSRAGRYCAFCSDRYFDTPPEKSRVVRTSDGWRTLEALPAYELHATTAEFRRVPNLFEILSLDYWEDNYGYEMPPAARERMQAYLNDETGRRHVMGVAKAKALASGVPPEVWGTMPDAQRLDYAGNFFAGGHDVIVARRHFADGATSEDHLSYSGSLSVEEHREYIAYTASAMRDLYDFHPEVKNVATFQNWLRPAGASFDHLHKQLVAIDERGVQAEREYVKVRERPNIYNEMAVDYAAEHGLILAENAHAVAFAGFGHRYPTLEVYSKSAERVPWRHSPEEISAVSELLHACHAATGPTVPTNEEWYYKPKDFDVPTPWRILVKWRISTLAGFEGGTKINVNTISPFSLHERVLPLLIELRKNGLIAPMRLGSECRIEPNSLQYVNGGVD
ncbi:MAG TPA: DUF4921 family protein [Actinomycetaceae bacterium]|nr:DUF4921 family protein [Actinomycetaceae bacterium]